MAIENTLPLNLDSSTKPELGMRGKVKDAQDFQEIISMVKLDAQKAIKEEEVQHKMMMDAYSA